VQNYGADARYRPPITPIIDVDEKNNTTQLVTFSMEPTLGLRPNHLMSRINFILCNWLKHFFSYLV
jgi:hypothetical protein